MTGNTDQKNGDSPAPGILNTALASLNLILFRQHALLYLFVTKKTTYNLVTIFLLMFLIPYRSMDDGQIVFLDFPLMASGFFITFVFASILYLFIRKHKGSYIGFLRVFMGMELVALAAPVTLLLHGQPLMIFTACYFAWYLSLATFAVSRLGGHPYFKSAIIVLGAYFMTIFLFAPVG